MTRLVVEDRFAEFGQLFDSAVKQALEKAATETRPLVQAAEPGTIASHVKISAIEPVAGKGYRLFVYVDDFRAGILERGTLGKHVGKLKRERKTSWQTKRGAAHRHREALADGGVAPRRYIARIGRQTKPILEQAVQRELSRL